MGSAQRDVFFKMAAGGSEATTAPANELLSGVLAGASNDAGAQGLINAIARGRYVCSLTMRVHVKVESMYARVIPHRHFSAVLLAVHASIYGKQNVQAWHAAPAAMSSPHIS